MEESPKKELKLRDEVSGKYNLVGVKPGKHRFPQFGELDLTAITLKDADALAKAGFPHLKQKSKVVDDVPAKQEEKPAKK